MAAKTTPWWLRAISGVLRGVRAGVAALFRPAQPAPVIASNHTQEHSPRIEEPDVTEDFSKTDTPPAAPEAAPVPAPRTASSEDRAVEPSSAEAPETRATAEEPPAALADLLAEAALGEEVSLDPAVAADPDPPVSPADLLAEAVLEPPTHAEPSELQLHPASPSATIEEPEAKSELEPETLSGEALEETLVTPEVETQTTPAEAEPTTSAQPEPPVTAPTVEGRPQAAAAPPQVVVHREAIKKEDGPDTLPISIFVNEVYEGPFDLLLDLIRKQDIDIYDIPIARITAQFLAYVDRLKASDMDLAGEFIYTASLLIHIKSKMLLPRNPAGPGEEAEDPRRELVERLLEHERFKNAAQMLQQKQMLESATWSNPGMRDFRQDVGAEPEIAADTVDLVRIFREILDRARSRPVLNVEEDSVTVGQMIQFLGRRLTMEDKPVALRRLLAHTKSERALIAMFLALLELVRLQAILLRQDREFSEIFIKKNSGFDAVMNEGLARDDWQ